MWRVIGAIEDAFHPVLPFPGEEVVVLRLVEILQLEMSLDFEVILESVVKPDSAGE